MKIINYSIEKYFSMLKSRLQKLDGLTHEKLKENITNVIREIPKGYKRNTKRKI